MRQPANDNGPDGELSAFSAAMMLVTMVILGALCVWLAG